MARKTIIAGNWKMNLLPDQAELLAMDLRSQLVPEKNLEVVVFPQMVQVSDVIDIVQGSFIRVGAQNCSDQVSGAFTGETSAMVLKSLGGEYCLAGHSERREYFQESDQLVAEKTKAICEASLTPIVCVGETLDEREAGKHKDKVGEQVKAVYDVLDKEMYGLVVLAYEPVWAIGTGKTASSEQAEEMHQFIREQVAQFASPDIAEATSILYGGSAKPANAESLLSQKNIDGLLVGGASLLATDFQKIIEAYQAG